MILKELRPIHFGKFHNAVISLEPGINLLYGSNEAGKSTLHMFIKGMFFGIDRARGRASKEDPYIRFQPWDTPGAYQGSMDIIYEGKTYRITRCFYQKEKSCKVVCLETGRDIAVQEGYIFSLVPNLTDSTFRNTVSIEQLHTKTDNGLAKEVRNYIANLTTSKSNEVDVASALNILMEKKKALEAELKPEEEHRLEHEIENLMLDGEKLVHMTEQLQKSEDKRAALKRQRDIQKKQEEAYGRNASNLFPSIIEKWNSLNEINRSLEGLKTHLNITLKEDKEYEKDWQLNQNIGVDLAQLEKMNENRQRAEDSQKEYLRVHEPIIQKMQHKSHIIAISVVLVAILICFIPIGYRHARTAIGVAAAAIGLIVSAGLSAGASRLQGEMEDVAAVYEKKLLDIGSKGREILLQYKVIGIEMLRNKYNEYIKNEVEWKHIAKQCTEYKKEIEIREAKMDVLRKEILEYMEYYIDDAELTQEKMKLLKETVQMLEQRESMEKCALEQDFKDIELKIERLKWDVTVYENNDFKLRKDKEQLEHLLEVQHENEIELEAVNLAIQTIRGLSVDIHDSFGRDLDNMLSKIISKVTEGKYQEVVVDEELSVKILCGSDYIPIERLSAGTIEQVYLALRLSVGNLFFPNQKIPLLFDDSFVLYDDERAKAVLKLLAQKAEKEERQILIFTCHHREKDLLDSLGISYHLLEL